MISHVFVGINDLPGSHTFYDAVLTALGWAPWFRDDTRPWAGWQMPGQPRPLFLIGAPEDGQPATAGNGQMVALLAQSRTAVDRAYAEGLRAGGSDAGAPGLRPQYHRHYYGAYLRDPEGNKIAIACHEAP